MALATTRVARRALLPFAAVASAACAVPLGHGAGAPTLERKRVAAKLAPDTLVADDGTRCTPSSGRFASTAAGASVWCAWVRTGAFGYATPAPR